jgi:hypothetical protein
MHSSRGSCIGSGELARVHWSSLWFSSFGLVVFCSLFELGICLGCVESLPLPKGIKTCPLQVILLFAFRLAFDRLLKFPCLFLFFSFSL